MFYIVDLGDGSYRLDQRHGEMTVRSKTFKATSETFASEVRVIMVFFRNQEMCK
jgi:hypothetical protein